MFAKKESELRRTRVPTVRSDGRASRRTAQALRIVMAVVLLLGATACDEEVTRIGGDSEELRKCRPSDDFLDSDEEIRSFAGCQVLEGSLSVSPISVSDLSPLSSLKVIEGILQGGYHRQPYSLDALHNLEVVGGDLNFFNDSVTSFQGLSNVHTVGGELRVVDVHAIKDLRGLEKVRSVSRLQIWHNLELRTLAGLEGLEEVTGDVSFATNPLLPAAEIDALLARIKVGGQIYR